MFAADAITLTSADYVVIVAICVVVYAVLFWAFRR